MKSLNLKMWRDLFKLKSQAITTSFLIISGVALLVSTWSAYYSLRLARDEYYKNYNFADVFSEFKNAPREIVLKIQKENEIEKVEGSIQSEGIIKLKNNIEPAVGKFITLPERLNQIHVRKGRIPVDSNNIEVLVHEGFAKANNIKPGDSLNVIINGLDEELTVVGIGLSPEYVYALSPSAPLPDDIHYGIFWMTTKNLERMMRMNNAINSVALKISKFAKEREVISRLDLILKPYGSRGAYARQRQISNMFVEDEIAEQKVSAIFVPIIFLGIASFLVNMIFSRLIGLHRPQIATLKALGYRDSEIFFHYFKIVIILTSVGIIPALVLGALLGSWMSNNYQMYFHFPSLSFSISNTAIIVGIIAGILPGIIGASLSLYSIFKLTPTEAMRPPGFPHFHSQNIPNFSLTNKVSVASRMILRNLFLRPMRLVLVVLSLSSALGIIITANSWADMINYLLKIQFNVIQRENLSIGLIKPQPSGVIQQVSRIKGVMSVEGFRVAPVRIKYLNFKRELTINGRPVLSKMHQLLDHKNRAIIIPETGVLLSQFFSDEWGLRPNDEIIIEFLEGAQKSYKVKVAGFSDDLIGISLNMKIESLWKLLDENPSYNQLMIQADRRRLSDIYAELKRSPFVQTVNLKESLYRGFQNSFGRIIDSMTMILMIASLLIAFGIIYNSIRVNYSERAWELASLKVLGFSHGSVSQIFLTEIGIQVLASLVPGCLIGYYLTALSMELIHSETFGFPIVIELATYARGLLIISIALIISAFIVLRIIKQLNPVDALKARD